MDRLSRISANNNVNVEKQDLTKKVGFVAHIILDENDSLAKADKLGSQSIGQIRYRQSSDLSIPAQQLPKANPFDKNFKSLPILNEQVEIYEGEQGNFYYRRIGLDDNPTETAFINSNAKNFSPEKDEKQTVNNYQSTSQTKIVGTNQDESKDGGSFGTYYQPQTGVHKLKLYEGDTLIESRFGQSIRFSAYNNSNGEQDETGNRKPAFAPTLIIRNRESSENNKKERGVGIEEDVNRDGSIIAMSSEQYQLPFLPGTVDDKGSTDFETKPESFENYPQKLIGNQLLLNSDRIILSAKKAEMIFYSKKNYGFISDGGMSIDNKGGIDISVKDNIHIVTNNRDVAVHTGKGSIFLGNENLEPMVKGQQLVDLLAELIDAIVAQNYLTPSGPTKMGPENVPTFRSIKSKLNNILSKLNQTS